MLHAVSRDGKRISALTLTIRDPTPLYFLMTPVTVLVTAPWLTVAPGLAIMLTVVSLNVLGDALRDAFDPHARLRIKG